MARSPALAAALLALVLAGCGGGGDGGGAPATSTAARSAGDPPRSTDREAGGERQAGGRDAGEKGTVIATADSQFGTILFDGDRRAVYLFDAEAGVRPECYGDCAAAWPPVLTRGEPQAGGSADPRLLGTTERDDGSAQVTYGGHPLY